MQWAHSERWVWLWLAPALGFFWVWAGRLRRAALLRVAERGLLPHLTDAVDGKARTLKAALVTGGLCCLLIGLLGPQWGFRWEEATGRGVDLLIALDVSKSMLAEDVKPNRLQRAKLAVQELVPLLRGDRVGLVACAGTAFVQCPLTTDYGAFLLALEELDVETIPRGGTALAQAIRAGLEAFAAASSESRALVLISDGEDHAGDAMAAAREAASAGVAVFAIGIGTPEGELIPVTDERGQKVFLKDREGRTVKTRLDEATLQQVALKTGGSYVRATATAFGLDLLYRERIAALPQREFKSVRRKRYEQRFQWAVAAALLLLGVELLVSDRRRAKHAPAAP